MAINDPKILIVQEYGPFLSISESADHLGLAKARFWKLLWQSLSVLGADLSRESFIETNGTDRFRFVGIAGIVVLQPGVRIEIVPKFLSPGSGHWRDDFLSIALITHHGHLLQNIPVPSRASKNVDLYEIIADAWVNLFEANNRSLIRTYVRTEWSDFHIDGEANEEDIMIPSEQGILQRGLKLSRSNPANSLLRASATILANRISNPRNLARLNRAISLLSPVAHEKIFSRKSLISRRPTNWGPLLELAQTITNNYSLGFSNFGHAFLPGYVIRTPYAWEKLMFIAIKRAFPQATVSKKGLSFGRRILRGGGAKEVVITPDVTLQYGGTTLIIDSKYKTLVDTNSLQTSSISVADIYEGHAYLRTTGTKKMLLFYPGVYESGNEFNSMPLEVFESGDFRIEAYLVDVTGVSGKGGLTRLAEVVRDRVSPHLTESSRGA